MGLSRSALAMYETGKRHPDFETLELFADFFNVDMNTLLGCSSAPTDSPAPAEPGLDSELVSMLAKLKPGEITRVTDFISGLIAAREES